MMAKPYKVELTKWGLIVTFTGRVCRYDLERWFEDIGSIMRNVPKSFHLLLDLVNAEPICIDSAKILTMARAFLNGRGLDRSVIIYDSSIKLLELNKAFMDAGGMNKNSRYISTHTYSDYMKPALEWLIKGVEP
jgi:hypothetical protein